MLGDVMSISFVFLLKWSTNKIQTKAEWGFQQQANRGSCYWCYYFYYNINYRTLQYDWWEISKSLNEQQSLGRQRVQDKRVNDSRKHTETQTKQ